MMENAAFPHLMRRYSLNEELFYYTTSDGREVDFTIARKGSVKALIQVTYELREEDKEQQRRELGALARASKELGSKNLYVVTWSQEGTTTYQGVEVKITPLWKRLLHQP